MPLAEFSEDQEKLLAKLLEEVGFEEEKTQSKTTTVSSEREQQLQNFFKAIEEANKQTGAHSPSNKFLESQQIGFQSTLKRVSINAGMFRQAYEDNAKVCYIGNMMCQEILYAMDMIPFNIEIIASLFAANNTAPKFLDIGEQNHLSRDICSMVRCVEGAARQNCLPTPTFIAHASLLCDSGAKMINRLKERYKCGYFMLDIPYNNDPDSVLYLSNQIKTMASAMEDAMEIKLDPERLEQAVNYSIEGMNYFLKTTDLYQNSFAPISLQKSKDHAMSYISLLGSKEMLEIARLYYEEVLAEIKVAKDSVKTKPRVIWHGLSPFYSDEIIRYLEDESQLDLVPEYNLPYTDAQIWMETDDPYLFLAQKLITFSGPGPLESVVKNRKLNILEEYSVDGVIIFNQWGCRHVISVNQIIRDLLSKKNIPVLEIDGDYVDNRNYSFSQIKVRIDAFAEILHGKMI